MNIRQYLKVLILGTLIITWTSCSRKDRIPVFDPAFEAYIESFTTGTVASEAFISIRFTFPVDTAVQKQLKATDPLRSRPKVRGNLSWPDAYTLVLKPEKPLKEGRIYLLSFAWIGSSKFLKNCVGLGLVFR